MDRFFGGQAVEKEKMEAVFQNDTVSFFERHVEKCRRKSPRACISAIFSVSTGNALIHKKLPTGVDNLVDNKGK